VAQILLQEVMSLLYVVDGQFLTFSTNKCKLISNRWEVFKDASSTAFNGTRGAQRCYFDNHQRGRSGKPLIDADFYYWSSQCLPQKLDLMSAAEFAEGVVFLRKGFESAINLNPFYTTQEIGSITPRGEDWQSKIISKSEI